MAANYIVIMDCVKCSCGKETWAYFRDKEEYESFQCSGCKGFPHKEVAVVKPEETSGEAETTEQQ